jgi:hypothetical protein
LKNLQLKKTRLLEKSLRKARPAGPEAFFKILPVVSTLVTGGYAAGGYAAGGYAAGGYASREVAADFTSFYWFL